MTTGVRKIHLLDYGWLAGEMGWFVPAADTWSNKQKGLVKPAEWLEIPVLGAVIEHKDGIVLMDTGCNPNAKEVWGPSWETFPAIRLSEQNRLENQLKLAGLRLADVNFVVLTHFHYDHAGQAYVFSDLKTPLVAHKKELSYASYLMWMGKVGDYLPVDLDPLRGAPWYPLDVESFELLPGIDLIWVGGHTPGSIMMRVVTDAGNNFIFTGDFIHMSDELESETKGWLLGDADEYLTSIRKLKLLAKRPNTRLVISHDPQLWEKYPKAPKFLE